MNRFMLTRWAGVLLLGISAAQAAASQTVVLDVQNMTCATCPITVRKALEKVAGVQTAVVDFEHKTATVSFDPDKANVAALSKATTNAGYPSAPHSVTP